MKNGAKSPTPAAQWRAAGEPDPHGKRYDCERADLAMGKLTDDELANGVFMNYNAPLNVHGILAGTHSSPIAWVTAAKDRIRWLSRSLERVLSLSEYLPRIAKLEEGAALPKGAPEADYYILENAMQRGFEMVNDDGDVYAVSSAKLVEFVKLYRDWKAPTNSLITHGYNDKGECVLTASRTCFDPSTDHRIAECALMFREAVLVRKQTNIDPLVLWKHIMGSEWSPPMPELPTILSLYSNTRDVARAYAKEFALAFAGVPVPVKVPVPPPMAEPSDVIYAEGWNACCDAFFGGKPALDPVVIEITHGDSVLSDAKRCLQWYLDGCPDVEDEDMNDLTNAVLKGATK